MRANASRRVLILGFIFAGLLALLVFGLSPRTISINARGMPLREVVRSFEKQGGIEINTNLDPETPISLYLNKSPVPHALGALATVSGSHIVIACAVFPGPAEIRENIASWEAGSFAGEWIEFQGPAIGPNPVDPMQEEWVVRKEESGKLADYLEQASVSTGMAFLVPKNLETLVSAPPERGRVHEILHGLTANHGLKFENFLLLVAAPEGSPRPGAGFGPQQTGPPGLPNSGRRPPPPGNASGRPPEKTPAGNPRDTLAFLKSRLGELPAEEQKKATEKLAEAEKLLDDMQDRPVEEQAAAFAAIIGSAGKGESGGGPQGATGGGADAEQARLERMMEAVESQMTPDQRSEFFRSYVEQKKAARQ